MLVKLGLVELLIEFDWLVVPPRLTVGSKATNPVNHNYQQNLV